MKTKQKTFFSCYSKEKVGAEQLLKKTCYCVWCKKKPRDTFLEIKKERQGSEASNNEELEGT